MTNNSNFLVAIAAKKQADEAFQKARRDAFHDVANYVRENPGVTINQISNATGVPTMYLYSNMYGDNSNIWATIRKERPKVVRKTITRTFVEIDGETGRAIGQPFGVTKTINTFTY